MDYTPYLRISLIVIITVAFVISIQHGILYFRNRHDSREFWFMVLGIVLGAHSLILLQWHHHFNPFTAVRLQYFRWTLEILSITIILLFVGSFLQVGLGRIGKLLIGIQLFLLLIHLFTQNFTGFDPKQDLVRHLTPWGEPLIAAKQRLHPLFFLLMANVIASLGWCMWAGRKLLKTSHRISGIMLIVWLSIMVISISNAFLNDFGIGVGFNFYTHGFAMILILMSISLADDRIKASAMSTELDARRLELEGVVQSASHELRTPMVNLQGFLFELRETWSTYKQGGEKQNEPRQAELKREIEESINQIASATNKMTRLLDGLLHVVRRSRFIARFQRVDMNRIWEDVMKDLHGEMVHVNAQVSVAQRLPPCKADPELMATVCKILLENALKFRHPDRPCQIELSGKKEYSRCIYSIRDNGIGFDLKHAHNLFSLFYQIHPHSADTGVGIGLAMAKQALARMGGGIQADGSTENGALFSFWLPR